MLLDWTDWLAEFAEDAPIITADVTATGQVAVVILNITAYTVTMELTAPANAAKGMKTQVICTIYTQGQVDSRPFQIVIC